MAVLEYETPQGSVRASQQVVAASAGIGGYYESFMGTQGTINLSEAAAYTSIAGHGNHESWDKLVQRGFLKAAYPPPKYKSNGEVIPCYTTRPPLVFDLPGGFNKPPHQPHLENFFAAIRGEATLNCDARRAFASEAPMHWVNPSARSRQAITFTDEHLAA